MCAFMSLGAVIDVAKTDYAVEMITRLGYPE